MNEIDEYELTPSSEPGRPRRPRWPIFAAVAVVLLALGLYFGYFRQRAPKPQGLGPTADALPGAQAPEETTAAAQPQEPLPALDASDALVRVLVARVSSHPQIGELLVTDDLVRRFVVSVENLAAGESPRTHLEFLAPDEEFQEVSEGGRWLIDPASYDRFDLVSEAFASLDAEGTVALYRRLEPLIDQAYRDLGYPDRDFDVALGKAIDRLLRTPVPVDRVELVPKGATSFAFADDRLESLSPAQKQLLRVGPENMKAVQTKLREIQRLLAAG